MIEPFPNCFSICEMALSIALDLSASAIAGSLNRLIRPFWTSVLAHLFD
jgi:hypothetical protein